MPHPPPSRGPTQIGPRTRSGAPAAVRLALLLLAGCHPAPASAPAAPGGSHARADQAQGRPAGADGSWADAGLVDAAAQAASGGCALTAEDAVQGSVVIGPGRRTSLGVSGTALYAAWVGLGCGGGADPAGLWGAHAEASRPAQSSALAHTDEGTCAITRSPAVATYLQHGAPLTEVFFAAGSAGAFDIRHRPLASERKARTLLASTATSLLLAAARHNDRPLLAWVERHGEGAETSDALYLRPHALEDATLTLLDGSEGRNVTSVQVAELGGARGERSAVVAWVAREQSETVLWLQALDRDGMPQGSAQRLWSELSGAEAVSIAAAQEGGAIAWDHVTLAGQGEVRWAELDAAGQAVGVPNVLTSRSEDSFGAALVARGGGYVLGYRARLGSSVSVRLAVLDEHGRREQGGDVAVTTALRDPLSLAVTADGRLWLGWTDANSVLGTLHVAQVGCDG